MTQKPAVPSTEPVEVPTVEINPLAHLIAPIAAIGATMLVRKMMTSGYERITGHDAPAPRDPRVSFTRALIWTAFTAATAAVVEVAVYRVANQMGERPRQS
jgi:Protein of unknown function (DUF4235)